MRLDGHSVSTWLRSRFSARSEACWRPSRLLTLALLLATTLALEAVDDVVARRRALEEALGKATAEFAGQVPADAYTRGRNGEITGVNSKDPRVQEIDARWREEMARIRAEHDVSDTRFDDLNEACRKAGVQDEVANSGSRPKSIKSDVDLTERVPGAGEKLTETLREGGYHVQEYPDRYIVQETDTTIWKKPPDMKVGSRAHREWLRRQLAQGDCFATSGGKFETTAGETGYLDPEGAALANANKMADAGGFRDPSTGIEKIDAHTVGKSASKAAEWTGTKTESEFFRKADALRNHASWEEAGVCHPADPPEVKAAKKRDFLRQAQESMVESVKAGRAQSERLEGLRTEQVSEAVAKGDHELANGVREQKADIKVGNQETLKRLAKTSPEFSARLQGSNVTRNPDGTFTDVATGETLTPSQVRERASRPAREATVRVTEEAIQGGEAAASRRAGAGKEPVGGEGGGMSTTMKAGGLSVLIYGIYEGLKTGVDQAVDEEKPDDYTGQTFVKAWAYSVWHGLGLGGAVELGREGARESFEQFRQDLKDGKDPSEMWAHMRAVILGYRNLVKAVTYGPLGEGLTAIEERLGLEADEAQARMAEIRAHMQLADAMKAKKDMFETLTGAGRDGEAAGTRPGLQVAVEGLARTFHTLRDVQGHIRKLCDAAASEEGDEERRGALASELYDRESPAIIEAWQDRREEYRGEYVGLVDRLRTMDLGVRHTPDPAVMQAFDKELPIEVEVAFLDGDINELTTRIEELLSWLAGTGSVRATCSFKGGPEGSFTKTLTASKPGKYEVSAEVTITCGEGIGGENAPLKCVFELPVTGGIQVQPPEEMTGTFSGTFEGGENGTISFTVTGTGVAGHIVGDGIEMALVGSYDPATGKLVATVDHLEPWYQDGKFMRNVKTHASLVGTSNGDAFRGTFTSRDDFWKKTRTGTWSATK
ncbi:MAG: hypothetical protein AAB434_08240 [Planctomycetota bacterium]